MIARMNPSYAHRMLGVQLIPDRARRCASAHHVEIALHGSGGCLFTSSSRSGWPDPLLRSRRALLRPRFRASGSLGRHPVQCRAELGQGHGRLGARRRRLVTARLTSGHAGSPAARLERSVERDSSDHARAAGHARCEGLGICIRTCSTAECETDDPVELASGRVAPAMEVRMRRMRQLRAAP